jgi:DNA recombination protein RmuC
METVLGHVDDTGSRLKSAVESYNKMVASLEGRVLVTLRRFRELGVASEEIDEPAAIESSPRQLNAPER